MAISSNGTVLARLAGGLYNQTLSNSDFTSINAAIKTAADINTFANEAFARDFAGKTDAQVATTLLANLGLSSVAGLNNWVAAQLTAAGSAGKGAKIVSMLNDFAGMTADATYGAAATAFNAKATSALALSQTSGSAGGDFNASATLAAAAAQAAADAAAAAAKAAADAAAKAAADAAAAAAAEAAAAAKAAADAAAKAAADAAAAAAAEAAAAAKAAADAADAAAAKAAADAAAALPKDLTPGADSLTGTEGNNTFSGTVTTSSLTTTFTSDDSVVDSNSKDSDVLNLTIKNDVTAANSGLVRGIETVNVNADATTLGGDAALGFAADNFTGTKKYNFDIVKAATAVDTLDVSNLAGDDITVAASDDFVAVGVEGAADKALTVTAAAAGTAGAATAVTITGTPSDVTVTGAGYLSVTSSTSTGLLDVTAANNLTVSADDALLIKAKSTNGTVTISDATASVHTTVTAAGAVSIEQLDAAGKVFVTSGGTITLSGSVEIDSTQMTLSGVGTSSFAVAADALTTVSLSGNGGTATYDFSAGTEALTDVIVSGSSNVKLQINADTLDVGSANLNVTDSGSGIFTLELKAGTAAGAVDLRNGGLVDKFVVALDNNAKTLSVGSGQTVTYKAVQTATTVAVGALASAAANSVTVKLDDEVRNSSAVDLTSLTVTQAKTVTIDASVDTTAAGTAVTQTIATLLASAANSNVTINNGVNNLVLGANATTSSIGTGNLVVTGSGTLTDATTVTSLTAASLDASAMTGAVTLDSTTALVIPSITTGSGADTVVLTTVQDQTVVTGAGNDSLTLNDGTYANKAVVINLGDGTDTLNFVASSELVVGTTGTLGTISVSGVETIAFAGSGTQNIQASLLSGKTYAVKATGAGNSVGVIVAPTDTSVDLSGLVGNADVGTSVAIVSFVTDGSTATAAITIKGISAAKNTITGSDLAGDSLVGGAKADTFVYTDDGKLFSSTNVGMDTISGGASATGTYDTIKIGTTGTAVTVVALDSWANVSSVESITTVDNTAAVSITLGATAETAGISRVDISADSTSDSVTNTVNVAAYTTTAVTITGSANADAITGGAGADVITGGVGVDTITGGAGNDNIKYTTDATIIASNAFIDSVDGGDGTDIITVGNGTATFTIASTASWSRVTSVETLKSAANDGAISLTLANSAYTAGIRTVDISAAAAATSNVINVDAVTGATSGMTLIGSATGETAITGGEGNDTISGGSANDTFNSLEGNDAISLSAGGTDNVVLGEGSGYDTISGFTAGVNTVIGYDTLELDDGTTDLAGADLVTAPGIATNDVAITDAKITTFNSIFTGTSLANYTNGSGLLALLKALNGGTDVTLTASANGGVGYLVAYQASNAYVYIYGAGALDDDIAASEISLIGVVQGVAAGSLVGDNFA
jgi:hypothetical protein